LADVLVCPAGGGIGAPGDTPTAIADKGKKSLEKFIFQDIY